MNWNPFREKPKGENFNIKISESQLEEFKAGDLKIECSIDGWIPIRDRKKYTNYWLSRWATECSDKERAEHQNRKLKTIVFMRLNAARDAKDEKTIATLTEIQEAMR